MKFDLRIRKKKQVYNTVILRHHACFLFGKDLLNKIILFIVLMLFIPLIVCSVFLLFFNIMCFSEAKLFCIKSDNSLFAM